MHLIDSHCHLDFQDFDLDRKKILFNCNQSDVNDIIVPGVTAKAWDNLIAVCQQFDMLHPALGLHPLFIAEHRPEHIQRLKKAITTHKITAIGEIGLDFYLPDHNKQEQIDLFTEQLKLAQDAQLPVLLHVRKAHDKTISLLKGHPVKGGIVHAFNGRQQQAEQYQKLGFYFGVGGAITHPRATRLRALIKALPLSSLVLETDSPDMPLVTRKHYRNSRYFSGPKK